MYWKEPGEPPVQEWLTELGTVAAYKGCPIGCRTGQKISPEVGHVRRLYTRQSKDVKVVTVLLSFCVFWFSLYFTMCSFFLFYFTILYLG